MTIGRSAVAKADFCAEHRRTPRANSGNVYRTSIAAVREMACGDAPTRGGVCDVSRWPEDVSRWPEDVPMNVGFRTVQRTAANARPFDSMPPCPPCQARTWPCDGTLPRVFETLPEGSSGLLWSEPMSTQGCGKGSARLKKDTAARYVILSWTVTCAVKANVRLRRKAPTAIASTPSP
jgi:hypothetical protein